MPSEEDQATATGNMQKKLVKFGHAFVELGGGQTDGLSDSHNNTLQAK